MASVTSTPLHDASVCLSCGAPATARGLDHSHIIARSQAPDRVDDPKNQVLQCRPCHDLITKKKARHSLRDHKKHGLWYVYERWNEEACDFLERSVRVKVDKKRGHLVSTAAAEGNIQAPRAVDTNIPSAAALSGEATEAEGRSQASSRYNRGSKGSASLLPASPVSAGADVSVVGENPPVGALSAPASSLEDWMEEGRCLRDEGLHLRKLTTEWAFRIGTWWNTGELKWPHESSQMMDDLGLSYWQITKFASVAARVPPENRLTDDKISLEHYRVAAMLPPETQSEALEEALAAGWSAASLREHLIEERRLMPIERPQVQGQCPDCGARHPLTDFRVV